MPKGLYKPITNTVFYDIILAKVPDPLEKNGPFCAPLSLIYRGMGNSLRRTTKRTAATIYHCGYEEQHTSKVQGASSSGLPAASIHGYTLYRSTYYTIACVLL